jgi:hypothetical protein
VTNLTKALDGMAGTIVLLFTIPLMGKIIVDINADTNLDPTLKLIVTFVGTLYGLGVLIFCVRSFIAQTGRPQRHG